MSSMFPDFSHWIWPIVALILFLFGVGKFDILWKEESESKELKFLVPLIEDCLHYVRYRDYDYKEKRIDKVKLLHKKLGELAVPTPVPIEHGEGFSFYHVRRGFWRECLEQWLPLAKEGRLKEAKKVYPKVWKQFDQGVFDPSKEVYRKEYLQS